ncbi:IS1/IS1595 family N-terminal zinc-binding domain-containing protein [Salinibacter ruber]|uniref:IS1/IS1595 family N-terminal zinc-binding domain-containing protein n=1 Tax=Salinibacter ruber TaxID=146919 RepID=UPI003C6DC439
MSVGSVAPRDTVKNGHGASGSQQYHCKDCGAHKVLGSRAAGLFRGGEREDSPGLP